MCRRMPSWPGPRRGCCACVLRATLPRPWRPPPGGTGTTRPWQNACPIFRTCAAFCTGMGPPCSPDASAGRPWRLVTLNTWKGDGPYALRLQAMVHQLRALQADVVALQEVFHAPQVGVHTGRTLAQALGMHLVFAPARRKRRWMSGQWVDSESGLAVLSRWPVAQQRLWPLPSIGADGERLALCCDLNVHGQPLRLVNTHLTHLGPCERGPALRQLQWQTLLTHAVDGWPAHAPLLVCGDLNVPLEDPSLRGPTAVQEWRDVAASVGL